MPISLYEPKLEIMRFCEAWPSTTFVSSPATPPAAKAEHYALAAYIWAWADGEPYVNRYELTKTTELLNELGVSIPTLLPYDPAKDEPFPWEADVRAAIEKLRKEMEERRTGEREGIS